LDFVTEQLPARAAMADGTYCASALDASKVSSWFDNLSGYRSHFWLSSHAAALGDRTCALLGAGRVRAPAKLRPAGAFGCGCV